MYYMNQKIQPKSQSYNHFLSAFVSVGITDPCRTTKCSYGQHCVLGNLGEARCECSVENECSEDVNEQVCGNDMRDYPSVCHVKKASCSLRRNIIVKYKGPCGTYYYYYYYLYLSLKSKSVQ